MFTHQLLLTSLAIYYVIVLLPALTNPKKFSKVVKSMMSDTDRVRLMGGFALLLSFIFLSVQYKFSKDWTVIVPIVGWIALIKGIIMLWYPKLPKKMWKKLGNEHTVALLSILGIILAIGLLYVAKELLPGYEIVTG